MSEPSEPSEPILCTADENLELFEAAVAAVAEHEGDASIGLDLEGVDLGRAPGTIEVVAVSTASAVFLLDAHGCDAGAPHIELLRHLVTLPNCVSVIHDCRQDADALWHHWGFNPSRMHDTQRAHALVAPYARSDAKLNDVLAYNGLAANAARVHVDYKANHAYWGARPLDQAMVAHASGDVASLRVVAEKQREKISAAEIEASSLERAAVLRDMETTWLRCLVPMRTFIGRGGTTIRHHERETGCYFYGRGDGAKRDAGFLVYYPHDAALRGAQRALGHRT